MITKEEKEKVLLFGSESRRRRSSSNNNNPLLPLQGQTTLTVAVSPSLTTNTVFSFSFPPSFFIHFITFYKHRISFFHLFNKNKSFSNLPSQCMNSTHLFQIIVSCFGIQIMEFKVVYYYFSSFA